MGRGIRGSHSHSLGAQSHRERSLDVPDPFLGVPSPLLRCPAHFLLCPHIDVAIASRPKAGPRLLGEIPAPSWSSRENWWRGRVPPGGAAAPSALRGPDWLGSIRSFSPAPLPSARPRLPHPGPAFLTLPAPSTRSHLPQSVL